MCARRRRKRRFPGIERTVHKAMEQRIQGRTRLLGLFGSPVGHSGSPAMYNFSFQQNGDDYAYLAFDVKEDQIGKAVEAARLLNMRGFNVTMPCKRAVVAYLDELTPAVELIGACNTVVNEDGVLKGYNTDGSGFVRNLKENGVSVQGKKLTVLGAGGAGTAIEAEVCLQGAAELTIFNIQKELDTALAMKEKLDRANLGTRVTVHALEDQDALKAAIDASDILANATSVGMKPNENATLIEDTRWFRPELVVADVVYNPLETRLLREAREAGCKTVPGWGMMLWQGATAYYYYSGGKEMPVADFERFRQSRG